MPSSPSPYGYPPPPTGTIPTKSSVGKKVVFISVGAVASIALAILISTLMQLFVGVVLVVLAFGLILSALT